VQSQINLNVKKLNCENTLNDETSNDDHKHIRFSNSMNVSKVNLTNIHS
jgi:hypothetical protein